MPGPPPTPTALNALRGDPGRRRRHTTEPKPPKGVPACPDYLDDLAKEEWQFIVPLLKQMGLLSQCDKTALEIYCQSYSRYRKAEEQVRKYGEVIISPRTKYPMVSPYVSVMNKNLDVTRRMLIEFGLTPAARARMAIKGEEGESDDFGSFILGKISRN